MMSDITLLERFIMGLGGGLVAGVIACPMSVFLVKTLLCVIPKLKQCKEQDKPQGSEKIPNLGWYKPDAWTLQYARQRLLGKDEIDANQSST